MNPSMFCSVAGKLNISASACVTNVSQDFAECVGRESILYVRTGCFACQKQEELFGEDYSKLNVIDCAIDSQRCSEAEIMYTPTWIVGEERYIGYQTFEEINNITGCPLN
jgi:hypothetical protein